MTNSEESGRLLSELPKIRSRIIPGKRLGLGHLDTIPNDAATSAPEMLTAAVDVVSGEASLIAIKMRLSAAVSSLVRARLDVAWVNEFYKKVNTTGKRASLPGRSLGYH